MKKIKFYIGSNNATKKLEKLKALKIFSNEYEWMTTSEVVWYWKWEQEKTLLVEIICEAVDLTQVKRVSKTICKELKQEAVMVEILDTNTMFISE